MPFQYKQVLVVGATSGIGEALASRLIKEGSKVIAVGRRQERLDSFVKTHGSTKASAETFDITNLAGVPDFAGRITKAYSDLDCIVLNSGVQRGMDFSRPESIDLDAIETEFTTNYLAYVHLTKAFLPFLLASPEHKKAIVYVGSVLGLVPLLRCPNYSATKAALHSFALVLRQQLRKTHVKIMEIMPPAVQSMCSPA